MKVEPSSFRDGKHRDDPGDDSSKLRLHKLSTFGTVSLSDGHAHVGISTHSRSPILSDPSSAKFLVTYLVSLQKPSLIVIADALYRHDMLAYSRKQAKNMPNAIRLALKKGDAVEAILRNAIDEVATAKGDSSPHELIYILRWTDLISAQWYKSLMAECRNYYDENESFRNCIDEMVQSRVEVRRPNSKDTTKSEKVLEFLLEELPNVLCGVHLSNKDGKVVQLSKDATFFDAGDCIHFDQMFYPTTLSTSFGLLEFCQNLVRDPAHKEFIDRIKRLNGDVLAAPSFHVLPLTER